MTSVNSNFDLGQLKSLYSQLDSYTGGQLGSSNTYVNSIFSLSGSIEEVANGNDQQKVNGIQNIIKNILSLLEKIGTSEAKTAKTEASNTAKKTEDLKTRSEKLSISLEEDFSNASSEIEKQTGILNEANTQLTETDRALKEQEKQIQEKIEEINKKQQELANAKTPEEQAALLGEIQILAGAVKGFAEAKVAQSETVDNLTEVVEDTSNDVATATEEMVGAIQVGSEEIAELTNDATNLGKTLSETSVRATENVTNKVALEAAATASKTNIITAGGSFEIEQKAKDQGQAAIERFQNIATNGQKIATGIGTLSNTATLLGQYNESTKVALTNFSTALGSWNATIPSTIKSLGSATAILTETETLNGHIEKDLTTIAENVATENEVFYGKNGAIGNTEKAEEARPIGKMAGFAPEVDENSTTQIELETPKFKYSNNFGI